MIARVLLRTLSLFLGVDNEREIVGDMRENHAQRVEQRGAVRATAWLVFQLMSLPLWLAIDRLAALGTPATTSRRTRGDSFMRSRAEDLRFALRFFLRAPGFSMVTVLTLALGIGANTAIFSVVDGVVLEGLPYPDSERLVTVWHSAPGVNMDQVGTATGLHTVYGQASSQLEGLTTYRRTSTNITGDGDPIRAEALTVTASFFEVLGTQPMLGRSFGAEEDVPDGPRVVVISRGLWQDRFGGVPDVLGRTILLNDVAHEIIGVMPEGFSFPTSTPQIILPLRIDPAAPDFGGFNTESVGLLADGSTPAEAERELIALIPRVVERFSDISPEMVEAAQLTVVVDPLKELIIGPIRMTLWIVMGTVGFVLLIASANVGTLFLARAEGRRREVAIRTAMGAGRRDLFWQFSMESGVLAVASGVVGTLFAWVGLGLLVAQAPATVPRLSEVGIDGSVLAFTAAISFGAALLFGAVPTLSHALSSPEAALRDGSRSATSGRRRNLGRNALVSSQIALALVLLVGSGLMLRSFRHLIDVDLGFQPEDVLTFRVSLPGQSYPDVESVARFHLEALEGIEEIPGVLSAGAVTNLPLSNGWSGDPLNREDTPLGPDALPEMVTLKGVSPRYFEVMGIPVMSGRAISRADTQDRSPVVVINSALAERYWPGESPIGRRIMHGLPDTGEWSTIVGVVGDTPAQSLTEPHRELVYYGLAPMAGTNVSWVTRSMVYTVRGRLAPEAMIEEVRSVLAQHDPNLPIAEVRWLDQHVADARVQMAFTMMMLSIAAGIGLLLGAIGIYGVISYLTALRTREIGLRMALGAEQGVVRGMVLRQGAVVALVGVALGLAAALALSRFLSTALYDVSPTDPATYAGVATLVLLTSMVATYLPARRAAATAPLEALRQD